MRYITIMQDGRTWSIEAGAFVESAPSGSATMFVDTFEDMQAQLRGLRLAFPGPYISRDVDRERDRRLLTFPYGGRVYDFCDDRGSDINISGAGSMAIAAITAGAQPGDLRWAGTSEDFTWLAANNESVPMDAQTVLAFAMTAGRWKASHIRAARALKDLPAIPTDYTADSRWPAS